MASSSSTAMDTSDDEVKRYRLSSSLIGHDRPVRCVCVMTDDLVATGQSYCDMKIFARDSKTDARAWTNQNSLVGIHDPEKLLYAIEKQGDLFYSAGGDNAVRTWTVDGDQAFVLSDPSNTAKVVSSIAFRDNGEIVTGSWDGQARIWRDGELFTKIPVGQYAVNVCVLATGEIVAGSADKTIVIYNPENQQRKVIVNAHNHAVRKIIRHPLGFASIGNDGIVKIWSNTGETLQTMNAHTDSEVKFTYDLALLPNMQLATCGEDGTVRILAQDGSQVQKIHQPGPVYNVKLFANGDLITACADRVARIFTRASERLADDGELSTFESLSQLAEATGMTDIDPRKMGKETDLQQPGTKHGQIKVFRTQRGNMVYKWDAVKVQWEEIGEALGQAKAKAVNGVEYDFVEEVEVGPTRKAKLGWNRDEDPFEIATRFCEQNNVPFDVRDQIVQYVAPRCDPELHAAKVKQEALVKAMTTLIHVPSWSSGGYHMYGTCKAAAMRKRLSQFNGELIRLNGEHVSGVHLDVKSADVLGNMCERLSDPKQLVNGTFSAAEAKIMVKLIAWPAEKLLPVVDLLRVLFCHSTAVPALYQYQPQLRKFVLELLSNEATASNGTLVNLVLKAQCNLIAKRPKLACETKRPASVPQDVEEFLGQVLQQVTLLIESDLKNNVNVHASCTMLMYNIVVWLGRLQIVESPLYPLIIRTLTSSILTASEAKDSTTFYGLLTIASIAHVSPGVKKDLSSDEAKETLRQLCITARAKGTELAEQIVSDITKMFAL